jgi:3'-5' exoribonuclease
VLPRYPKVNPDLVLAGIFFHDAGKIAELSYEHSFEYSNEGQLLGHIVQASMWISDAAKAVEQQTQRPFPRDLLHALLHVVVAHHGQQEFGSPKTPATPEACMVHYLDHLDAKLNMVFTAIETDPDVTSDWTAWVSALQTRVFKGAGRGPSSGGGAP